MLMDGHSQTAVARQFGVAQCTINRLYTRFRATGSVSDRPRSGRPRITTARQDRAIRLLHLRDRFKTAAETASHTLGTHGRPISAQTARNRLRAERIIARRPYVGPPLTPRRRQVRLDWMRRHGPNRFGMRRWRRVMFTDESRFSLYRSDGRKRVYRRRGERFADACVVERDRFGGASVMVWGGISHGVKSPLVVLNQNLNAVRYRDQILQPHVLPLLRRHNLIFQQDNARPHVARVCRDFLTANNVQPLEWPPYSPDMSPIEHLWDELDRRIRKRQNPPTNRAQLIAALTEEWNNIPLRRINVLMNSMHKRIRAGIRARGAHTRY